MLDSSAATVLNLQTSEDHVRAEVRRQKIVADPDQDASHLVSLDGEVLHPSLLNFDVYAVNNYAVGKQQILENSELSREKVFVTSKDAAMEKMTKSELCEQAELRIAAIGDEEERERAVEPTTGKDALENQRRAHLTLLRTREAGGRSLGV